MSARSEAFMAAMRGIPTHHVVKAMTWSTPGMNWIGCSKALMASNVGTDARLGDLDLDRVARRAKARAAGDSKWMDVR